MTLDSQHFYHEITARLIERLDYIRIDPAEILIVGVETDLIEKKIHALYPTAKIHALRSQKELTDILNDSVDLVFAAFPFLMNYHLSPIFKAYFRVLKKEGLFLFSEFGPDTFREVFQKPLFLDMHDMGDALKEAHFSDPVMDREEIKIIYDDFNTLKQDIISMIAVDFENTTSTLEITLEAVYGHALKLSLPQKDNEITVSIDSIRKRKS